MIKSILSWFGFVPKGRVVSVDKTVLVKQFDESDIAYWAALSLVYKSEEFRCFLSRIEGDLVAAVAEGGAALEHKAGALYGVRMVARMIYQASLTCRKIEIEKQLSEGNE